MTKATDESAMGAEFEVAEEQSLFSARKIQAMLQSDSQPIKAFRDTLAWGQERLYNFFHDGAPAESLVRARAFLVDEVLRTAWQRTLPNAPAGVSLVAVGGYGRSELLPHSDIDILLLFDGDALDANRQALEQFLAFMWDIGLEVGSSVRSITDCVEYSRDDLTVITNLMEARYLDGDTKLYASLEAALAPEKVWPVERFFRAKLEEQSARHRKFDDTGYKLEPNVKESPGGLRDIQTIAWVAKRHFGAQTLSELRERGFLSKQECDELFGGQDFLWRVRFALHMLTGRKEDRLLFDHQIKAAGLFGYVDQDHNLAVEQFMQLYYRTIKSLSCLNDMLLQLFDEAILRGDENADAQPLNRRFQVRRGFLEATSDEVFRRHPFALIEIFAALQKHPEIQGISASTLRLLRRDRRLVDEGLRENVRARDLFLQMFREGRGLTRALRSMNRYGVLGRYLPSFGLVIGHMQYDLFHTLTVDEHSLYVVRNLRRMAMERFRTELPFCNEVMERIPKKELLYLSGLFHDLGKGRGGDHSEIGAEDATNFCLDHGLSHADAELVAWLVRNHLTMSLTAQRMDISDPQVVADFAAKVGDRSRLDYLFLVTCADIRATNPALWNSWRESLLNGLYRATTRAFERGLHNPVKASEVVAERKQRALKLLADSGIDESAANTVWARFDEDYFLRHSDEELAWHLPAIVEAGDGTLPLVLVRDLEDRGTTVFLYTRDRDHLFALCTGVLAQLGLSILDARLNTTADGFALDTYVMVEGDGSPINDSVRHPEIADALRRVLSDPNVSSITITRRAARKLKSFNTPTHIYISQDDVRERTILELVAPDQPGLLSIVGRIFQKRGILLDAAKIGTIGERAEDVFFITDREHHRITDEDMLEDLREVLTRTLNRRDASDEARIAA